MTVTSSQSSPASSPQVDADLPLVSIIMPCLNEVDYIEECLRTALAQTYPSNRLEILVADGGSSDGTRDILARISAADPRIRVIDNPDRIQSAGMNRAIRAARGDIIVRMDVHCEFAPDYVETCVRVLRETGADNAGGCARPAARNRFQRALCAVLSSRLGTGGSPFRTVGAEGFVDTVFPGSFRRMLFEKVGLFDGRAVTNEDAEFNQRVIASGGKVYLSRAIGVSYYPRDSFRGLARQYFRYGSGRARTLLKHRGSLTVRPFVPLAMVAGATVLLATPGLRVLAPFAFGAYGVVTLAEAIRVARQEGAAGVLLAWAMFPTMHLCHGAGAAVGLVRYALRPDWGPVEFLEPRASAPNDASSAPVPAAGADGRGGSPLSRQ